MRICIGDIHGCLDELKQLLSLAAFDRNRDTLISVGDMIDRGPYNLETLRFIKELPSSIVVRGNHDDKIRRWLSGNPVQLKHGAETTAAELDKAGDKEKEWVLDYLNSLPTQYADKDILVVHAMPTAWGNKSTSHNDVTYGFSDRRRMYGEKRLYKGVEVRWNWWDHWDAANFDGRTVCFGHYWFQDVVLRENIVGLDTSCVRGGQLSGYIVETGEIVKVDSNQSWIQDNQKDRLEAEAWATNWLE